MYFYFASDFKCALKLGGVYYGVINGNVLACNIDISSPTLIEICSLDPAEKNLNFILDGDFCGKIDGARVTDLKGGYLLSFYKSGASSEFKIFAQEKFPNAVATLFNDGGIKLSIETHNDFYAEALNYQCHGGQIKRFNLSGAEFLAVAVNGQKTALYVYSVNGKVNKVFEREVDDYSLDGGFKTVEKPLDIAKHTVTCEWDFDGNKLVEKNRAVTRAEKFDINRLNANVIPFAFLEEYLAGGDITPYLTGGLKDNASKLGGYLGDFIGIMPPPTFRDIGEIGLIYRFSENSYTVDYITFEFLDGKLCNLKKLDY